MAQGISPNNSAKKQMAPTARQLKLGTLLLYVLMTHWTHWSLGGIIETYPSVPTVKTKTPTNKLFQPVRKLSFN